MIDFKSKQIKILPYIIHWMMVLLSKTELHNKKQNQVRSLFIFNFNLNNTNQCIWFETQRTLRDVVPPHIKLNQQQQL